MITKVLLIGCGDIAIRLAALLPAGQFQCHGLRRDPTSLPGSIRGIPRDLNQPEGLASHLAGFDVVVITLVPNARNAAGYQRSYVENMQHIIAGLEAGSTRPKLVLFVSSTSVYGQNQGEWVNEQSTTAPRSFRGQAVLEGEGLLRRSTLSDCIVRFSGIYGPGRERLLEQVRSGDQGERDSNFSNRIHADDCAGVLAYLIQHRLSGKPIDNLYLASDCEPTPLAAVKRWLAEQMGLAQRQTARPAVTAHGNKRCCNQGLLATGFRFKYPSFREGYADLLEHSR